MDAVTHAMTGLVVATIASNKSVKIYPALLTGVLAALLPDLDSFIIVFGMDVFKNYHRLFTHTVFALPVLAALAAAPAWIWQKNKFVFYYAIAAISLTLHLVGDVICLWEIALLYPLNRNDYSQNLFNGKDTSVVVLFVMTALAMGLLYRHQKKTEAAQSNEK